METITINGVEYGLFAKGEDRSNPNPHMVNLETGETPLGRQRPMLRDFLVQNGVNVEPWEPKTTHWAIDRARELTNPKDATLNEKDLKGTNDYDVDAKDASENDCLELSAEEIGKQNALVEEDPTYGAESSLIGKIVRNLPRNEELEIIALKIALIDITNSTRLFQYKGNLPLTLLAKIIKGIDNIDERLKNGDPKVVEEIARKSKEEGKVNLFSFASKYCHYHNFFAYGKDDYSIYDTVVKDSLPHYAKISESAIETWRKNFQYTEFNDFIGNLLDEKGIKIPNRRTKFDHFLWYANRKKN